MEVIAVRVHEPEEAELVKDILESHNGENIRYFGSWAVTDLQDQGRATS